MRLDDKGRCPNWMPTFPDNGKHDYIHAKPTAAALRIVNQQATRET